MFYGLYIINNIDWPAWITAFATSAGVILAFFGFDAWKKQLRGKNDYILARRYLRAVFKLRDAIAYVRNPFISLNEMQSALQEHGHDSSEYEDKAKTNRAVYSNRWKKVQEAWTNLEVELIEAEVSWGVEATKISQPLIDLVKKLFAEIQMYLDGDVQIVNRKLIYNHGSFDNPDEFSKEVYQAIDKIRQYLQPHLL